jgi:plastocyanin
MTAARAGGALAVTVLMTGLGGCGTDPDPDPYGQPPAQSPTPAPTPAPTSPSATEPPAGDEEPTVVNITLIDNELQLDEATFTAGTYTFVAEQAGQNPHALSIEGPGVSESTPRISPGGESEELTVTLEPGTYELWCPVPGHREDGMEATIEVT